MNLPRSDELELAVVPEGEMVKEVCGLYFRSWTLGKRGRYVPQHAHDYDHATILAHGAVSLWLKSDDGRVWHPQGEFRAPDVIMIPARKVHAFIAIEANTRLFCVHNLNGEPYRTLREKGGI